MVLSDKIIYITQFISQGISLDQAYALVYLTKEERLEIETDQELIQSFKDTLIKLTAIRVTQYNNKVNGSINPSDDLKRLNNLFPEVFEGDTPKLEIGELIINKVRGEVQSEGN